MPVPWVLFFFAVALFWSFAAMGDNKQTHEEWIREIVADSMRYSDEYIHQGPEIDDTLLYSFDNQPVYWNLTHPNPLPSFRDLEGRSVAIPDEKLMRLASGEFVWFNGYGQLVTCDGNFNTNPVADNAIIGMGGLFFTAATVPRYPLTPSEERSDEIVEDKENRPS